MNTRELNAEVARLANERGWAYGDPRETYLLELVSQREEARHAVQARSGQLRHCLDNLVQMTRGTSAMLNSLGELQQLPAHIEAAVGAFEASRRALDAYLRAFPPLGTP